TYMAYLVLEPLPPNPPAAEYAATFGERLSKQAAATDKDALPKAGQVFGELAAEAKEAAAATPGLRADGLLAELQTFAEERQDKADADRDDDAYEAWDKAREVVTEEQLLLTEPMKDPALLRHIERLQEAMAASGYVGKSTSVVDVIKTVHRDMYEGDAAQYRIPDSRRAVGSVLMQFQSGHRPGDLFHMVTRDYKRCALWVQLKSGDNQNMQEVVRVVDSFFDGYLEAPPMPVRYRAERVAEGEPQTEQRAGWFGLTYINVEWQDKMVSGMLMSFMGSFLVVFLMMIVLFRSALWGLLSMIPLTVTIALIYGLVGLLGIDYDMPIAVLSSLTLGLAVDFAIHFLARSRQMVAEIGSWDKAAVPVFGEPARAITRNIIVIAVGFLPLLAAPLMPYKTVGIFLATILMVSGVGTLIILPALVKLLQKRLFLERKRPLACYCGTCFVAGLAAVATIVVNVWQYVHVGITMMTWISIVAVPVLFGTCCFMSRRQSCAARAAKANVEVKSND
ncbi:MAG: MMPL family transporter, partial [Planctomycetes bacterium]|nr:MMPL family transporter [Planctomycetota bacterium]